MNTHKFGIDAGKDTPIETQSNGAKQSALGARYDLIDGPALAELAKVLDYGAKKYAPNNWRGIDTNSHLNHAIMHAYHFLAGDTQDDHLSHFFCRAMMALAAEIAKDKQTQSL